MGKRLQIIMQDEEVEVLRKCAEREGLTLSEWARRALRRAQRSQKGLTSDQKLRALERALQCGHPTADIDEILVSIEKGRGLR